MPYFTCTWIAVIMPSYLRHHHRYSGWSACMNGNVAAGTPAKITPCKRTAWAEIAWRFDAAKQQLINKHSGLCLDAIKKPPHKKEPAMMQLCDDAAPFQKWTGQPIESLKCNQAWCQMK